MPSIVCNTCSSEFHVPPSRATAARFCSPECRRKGNYRNRVVPTVALNCPQCGKGFEKPVPHVKRAKVVFCSFACASAYKTKRPTTAPSMTDWIWLAGFIDGEGTFTAMKGYKGGARPAFHISNCNQAVMVFIQALLGGSAMSYRDRGAGKWNPSYKITVSAKELLRWVIDGVHPYLRVKARHAALCRHLLDHPHDVEAREELRRLNTRGITPPVPVHSPTPD